MTQVLERHGIRFEYPDDWILHEQSDPLEFTVTVHSPETSFWSLTLLFDRPEPQQVLDSALDAFREVYSELDIYPGDDRLADRPTLACDLDFVCHELISTAFLRAIATPRFTILVLFQGADLELDETQVLLEQITRSLTWDDPADAELDENLAELFLPENWKPHEL